MSLFRTKDIDAMLAERHAGGLKKVLGPMDLVLMGIGAIIGTGIFVLTGTGALTAGPGLMISFIIAAVACGFAALCYAEFASAIPVSGSIYTYSYATLGEIIAWMIGWDLLLEYGLATSAVSVGWSGYFQSLVAGFGLHLPVELTAAPGAVPGAHTLFNLPALLIMLAITWVVACGVRESARLNNLMVAIKIAVVLLFIVVGVWHVKPANWQPFAPFGATGIFNAAALVFFAFIGFDAVTSAAEEVRNPHRDLPVGIIGSLTVCTVLYVIVAAIMTGVVPFAMFAGVDHPVSLVLQYADDHGDPGDDLWPDPCHLRDVARRPAACQAVVGASGAFHAVLCHLGRRHRVRDDCCFGAAQCAGRADQYRHAVCVHADFDRGAGAAPDPSRSAAGFPLPRRAGGSAAVGGVLPVPDGAPGSADLDRLPHLAGDRAGNLLPVRTPQCCAARRRELASAFSGLAFKAAARDWMRCSAGGLLRGPKLCSTAGVVYLLQPGKPWPC
jgi:hypothetical protein